MNKNIKNSIIVKSSNIANDVKVLHDFMNENLIYIQEIIRNTIISIKKNKQNEIFSNNDINLSVNMLNELYEKTKEIEVGLSKTTQVKENEQILESLQKIIDKLSMIICGFGTKNIKDLLFICFGSEFAEMKIEDPIVASKYEIIQKYIQPIGYKIINWKNSKTMIKKIKPQSICSNKIVDDILVIEDSCIFECFDVDISARNFFQKIYGIRVIIQNEKLQKTLIINGIIDDIQLSCFSNKYIDYQKKEIVKSSIDFNNVEKEIIERILETMTIKDVLIYGINDYKKKMISIITEVGYVKNMKLNATIKKFIDLDVFFQRNMIINLLLYVKDEEITYISYLLYELLTVDSVDTNEQCIYESLPYGIKTYFKDIIKCTIKTNTENTQKYDNTKVSLEHQIYLMKSSEQIKEKAMMKLKEIKGRSEEMSSKAKHYLEGLLKIPFGIYREEPILIKTRELNKMFNRFINNFEKIIPDTVVQIPKKTKYTVIEMNNILNYIEKYINSNVLYIIEKTMQTKPIKYLNQIIKFLNTYQKTIKKEGTQNKHDFKNSINTNNKDKRIENIIEYLKENQKENINICGDIFDILNKNENTTTIKGKTKDVQSISMSKSIIDMTNIKKNTENIESTISNIMNVLDESIYGHKNAKNQIMKIIAQWINGEQTGYCFGFEGSPGIGKTSLAKKGLANCLKNEDNISRPFTFIALGGSSNGSFLEGHGYTYMNSSWGKIVDILMESKCMNPIIYIDELDKVSKTENGREIIGILTHLIDSTQNDEFHDKYFNGIDIDVSKILFIFSYNDAEQIDSILLDRIHRIKFDNLSTIDKLVIVKKHLLPEINTKMGFENVIEIEDEVIQYIIETYTSEPGVRKLKEIIFDLYGEINLDILQNSSKEYEIPIVMTIDNIQNKYLKKYKKIDFVKIHQNNEIGIINGLWANSMGRGGVIPIECFYFPSSTFLEFKLTGLQGDVMKESMNVAKTLAWNLTPIERKKELIQEFETTKCQGLHIHCPEGAISKDGPSAGGAITSAIYSLFNNKKINHMTAMTGEITLQGNITAIGGLDIKINGGIRAGVKTFIYPKSNNREFLEWKKKNSNIDTTEIKFIEVSRIEETFQYLFE